MNIGDGPATGWRTMPLTGRLIGRTTTLGFALAVMTTACTTTADAGAAPGSAAAHEITMVGERLFPESITSDAAGNIYVGSNPGIVFRALRGSDRAEPWIMPDAESGLQSVFGVLADDARGLLWVCSNPNTLVEPRQTGLATVKAFTMSSGQLMADYPFPADAGPSLCNDMTIAPNGDLYATDTVGARIFRLRSGGSTLDFWGASDHFASIDGISFGRGGALYANSIQRNTLLRVGMGPNESFGAVEVLQTTAPMAGPDGLRPLGGNRMLQSEGNAGTITVLTFPETGPVEIEVIASGIDYASSVTMVGTRAYYPEGKLSYMFDPAKRGQDPGTFVIRSVEIPQ